MAVGICLPSRGRGRRLLEVLWELDRRVVRPDTVVCVGLDADDEGIPELPDLRMNVIWSIEGREDSLGEKYNRCARLLDGLHLLLWCDDLVVDVDGFDEVVERDAGRWGDGLGFMGYGEQPWGDSPMTVGMTAGMFKELGYFMPPYFPAWYHEVWIDELAKLMGRYHRSNEFTAVEKWGRGNSIGLRDVPYWGRFFFNTRLHRIKEAGRFLEKHESLEVRERIMHTWPNLIRFFETRCVDNCDENQGGAMERHFSVGRRDDVSHRRLVERAEKLLRELHG